MAELLSEARADGARWRHIRCDARPQCRAGSRSGWSDLTFDFALIGLAGADPSASNVPAWPSHRNSNPGCASAPAQSASVSSHRGHLCFDVLPCTLHAVKRYPSLTDSASLHALLT